jgi:membrane protein implicated in regulation of membrane protease activity
MTWSDFYLICFLLGFALSLLSVLTGSSHLHLPHLHLHFHGVPQVHAPGAHGGQVDGLPWLSFGTITAFLAWFGGTGYLLEHYYSVWFLAALGIATLSGLGGAAIVLWFMVRFLVSKEENLDPADYEMVGVLGKLSIPIRQGGTGEIIFTQEGVRRVSGARSEDGVAIPKGTEVVVTRYEKGIAYVRRWEDLAGTAEDLAANERG